MKIAVCDDNPVELDQMVYRLEEYFSVRTEPVRIDEYLSVKSLLKTITKYKYDAVFLEFNMKELNGLQTVLELKKIDDEAAIIFNTHEENSEIPTYGIGKYTMLKKTMTRVEYLNSIDKIYHDYKTSSPNNDRNLSRILFTEKNRY